MFFHLEDYLRVAGSEENGEGLREFAWKVAENEMAF